MKNPPANIGDPGHAGWISRLGRYSERKWQPVPVFLPGKFHGQRSLASYYPGCCKELNVTEHSHTLSFSICCCGPKPDSFYLGTTILSVFPKASEYKVVVYNRL